MFVSVPRNYSSKISFRIKIFQFLTLCLQNPVYDGGYNTGLRRDQISRIPNYYEYPIYNYGPLNYATSNYETFNYGRSYIPAAPYDGQQEEAYYDSEEESHAYLEPINHETGRRDEIEYVPDETTTPSHENKYDNNIENEKDGNFRRNEIDDAKKAILDYYKQLESTTTNTDNNVGEKKTIVNRHHSDKYKKVQVQQEEETGVPRVQVNAGYQSPKIQCEGSELCSGVLLKWVITFYGTCVGQNCN